MLSENYDGFFLRKISLLTLFFAQSGAQHERSARTAVCYALAPRVRSDKGGAQDPLFLFLSSFFFSCVCAIRARRGRRSLRLHSVLPRALRPRHAPVLSPLTTSASAVALHFTPAVGLFGKKPHLASSRYFLAHHQARTTAPALPPLPATTLQPSSTPPPPPQRPPFLHRPF